MTNTVHQLSLSGKILLFPQKDVQGFINYYEAENGEGLIVSGDDFPYKSFLNKGLKIKALSIYVDKTRKQDWSFLKEFKDVEDLSFSEEIENNIDLTWFPNLSSLSYQPDGMDKISETKIKSLLWKNLKSESKSLDLFVNLPASIENLMIAQTNVKSLKGIERLKKLKKLNIVGARKLVDISALGQLPDLGDIDFSYSPNIDISNCPNLPKLTRFWYSTGKLPTVAFLKKMPNLKQFFTNATILDKDLSFFKDVNWEFLYFKNSKEYSQRLENFYKSS